jgi:hypothetical protein
VLLELESVLSRWNMLALACQETNEAQPKHRGRSASTPALFNELFHVHAPGQLGALSNFFDVQEKIFHAGLGAAGTRTAAG